MKNKVDKCLDNPKEKMKNYNNTNKKKYKKLSEKKKDKGYLTKEEPNFQSSIKIIDINPINNLLKI
jgi:hypothetical protein